MKSFINLKIFFLKIAVFLSLTGCQSKNKVETPSFYKDVQVVLEANKIDLYNCYKKYVSETKKPKNGKIYLQWKLYDTSARDIYINKGISNSLEVCLTKVIRGIRFDDLFLGGQVRIIRYVFKFNEGILSFHVNKDELVN